MPWCCPHQCIDYFLTNTFTFTGPLCPPALHSCTASCDTVSFSDGWRALHNTRTHKSVYAAKVNSVKSKGLFVKMSLMQFQWLVLLTFLLGRVSSSNTVRLPHSPDWTNILKKYIHPLGEELESIMYIFQTLLYFPWKIECPCICSDDFTWTWSNALHCLKRKYIDCLCFSFLLIWVGEIEFQI